MNITCNFVVVEKWKFLWEKRNTLNRRCTKFLCCYIETYKKIHTCNILRLLYGIFATVLLLSYQRNNLHWVIQHRLAPDLLEVSVLSKHIIATFEFTPSVAKFGPTIIIITITWIITPFSEYLNTKRVWKLVLVFNGIWVQENI
jgi:hypothetical protein